MYLSIIIPVFNAEKYIENCLNSIFNQNIKNTDYEIIIINDGSTDSTIAIIHGFQDNHTNISLINQDNQGSSVARNKGLEIAKGEYIYFLDSDDYLAKNTLNIILNSAIKNNVDLVTFNTTITSKLDLDKSETPELSFEFVEIIDGQHYLNDNPNFRPEIWWYFIKKTFLEGLELKFKKGVFNQDVIFTITLFLHAKKIISSKIDTHRYLQSENSVRSKKDLNHLKKLFDDYIVLFNDMEKLFAESKKNSTKIKSEILNNLIKRKYTYSYFVILRIIQGKLSSKFIKEYIFKLKESNSYPIPYSVAKDQSIWYFYILIFIINNKFLLLFFNSIYKRFK